MPDSVNIQIGGDVTGTIVYGDNNLVVNTNHGTIVYKQGPRVKVSEFSAKPPRPPHGFINRTDELTKLESWIAAKDIVLLYAPDGMGKTSLLKQVANSKAGLAMSNGVIMLESVDVNGQALGPTDIIQRLFDALFESDPPLKVDATSARTYLSNTGPLVLFDEVPLPAILLRALPDFFPKGAIIITADLPSRGEFQRLSVGPLPRNEAISLLANRAGIQNVSETRKTLDLLCAHLGNVSLAIIICANVMRELNITPEAVLQEFLQISASEPKPGTELERAFEFAFSKLHPQERKIISTAALTPGISMTPEWLDTALGGVASAPFIDRLKAMGLLFENSPRLRLPPGFQPSARRAAVVQEQVVLPRLADYLLVNAEKDVQNWEFFKDELGNLSGTLAWAIRTKNWEIAMRLARTLDPYLSLHGLWDAWREALDSMLLAASQTGNQAAEAWALHQLGTREIGVGTYQQALDFLRRALEIRRVLGDTIGMAYTQHNIDFLISPPSAPRDNKPKAPSPKSPRKGINWLLLLGAVGIMGLVLLAILIGPMLFVRAPATATRAAAIPPAVVTLTRQPATSTPIPQAIPPTDRPTPIIISTHVPRATSIPTPLGGSGQLVFTVSNNTLFVRNVDGSNLHEVPADFISAQEPAWSPNGKTIAFVHFDDRIGSYRIYTVNADGFNPQPITAYEEAYNMSHPTWSPNGKSIAFLIRYPDYDGSDLYVMNTDSGEFLDLTHSDGEGHYDYPEWSPDGKHIAYHAFVDNNWELFVMDSDGSNPTRLTYAENTENTWSIQPSWSPDSQRIAFASGFEGSFDIYVMNSDGSGVIQLTQGGYNVMPDWSPDGRLIAFSSNRGGNMQIYTMPTNGLGLGITLLTKMAGDTSEVDWQP